MLTNKRMFAKLIRVLALVNAEVAEAKWFQDFLWKEMDEDPLDPKRRKLYEQDRKSGHAYFLVQGHAAVYYFDKKGNKRVIRLYRGGRIIASRAFLEQAKSLYYVEASKSAVLLSINQEAMLKLYKMKEGMREFALQTAMRYDEYKEKLREDLLALEPRERVLTFYKEFPGLLPPGKQIKDEDIELYLHLSRSCLKEHRAGLLLFG